jgi:hypothetical protein
LVTSLKKNQSLKVKARWPITIITNRCLIEGESRNITANGILVRFKEPLHENGTYRIIITLPQKRYIAVRGRVIWSNLDGIAFNDPFSDMAFYFVELDEEGRSLLNQAVLAQIA